MMLCIKGDSEPVCSEISLTDLVLSIEIVLVLVFISFVLGGMSGSPSVWRQRWRDFRTWVKDKPPDVAIAIFPTSGDEVEVHRTRKSRKPITHDNGIKVKFDREEEEE